MEWDQHWWSHPHSWPREEHYSLSLESGWPRSQAPCFQSTNGGNKEQVDNLHLENR